MNSSESNDIDNKIDDKNQPENNKEETTENVNSIEDNTKSAQDEQNELLNKLFNNVNYAIILAFFDKFADHLGLKDIILYKNFESSLINKKTSRLFEKKNNISTN